MNVQFALEVPLERVSDPLWGEVLRAVAALGCRLERTQLRPAASETEGTSLPDDPSRNRAPTPSQQDSAPRGRGVWTTDLEDFLARGPQAQAATLCYIREQGKVALSQLHVAFPGCGTNVLEQRLRHAKATCRKRGWVFPVQRYRLERDSELMFKWIGAPLLAEAQP